MCVDRHGALALVETSPVKTVTLVQRPATDIETAAGWIDAEDVGAERGKRGATERRGDEGRDLDDPKSSENRTPDGFAYPISRRKARRISGSPGPSLLGICQGLRSLLSEARWQRFVNVFEDRSGSSSR